jgi:hypothetical protein
MPAGLDIAALQAMQFADELEQLILDAQQNDK